MVLPELHRARVTRVLSGTKVRVRVERLFRGRELDAHVLTHVVTGTEPTTGSGGAGDAAHTHTITAETVPLQVGALVLVGMIGGDPTDLVVLGVLSG